MERIDVDVRLREKLEVQREGWRDWGIKDISEFREGRERERIGFVYR